MSAMISTIPATQLSTTAPQRQYVSETTFASVVTAVFLTAALFSVWHHVPWRDEIRWWQLALLSPTFAEMRSNMQFEGVPWLWYGILWLLSRLTTNLFVMQVVHVCTAAATVFLFARWAPFSRRIRWLFAFGYYPFFEYAVISRNYALIFLLVLAAVALIARPRSHPWALSGILFLLTQTSIWGAGLAVVLLASSITQQLISHALDRRAAARAFLLPTLIVVAGCVVCYRASMPGPGETFIARWPEEMSYRTRLSVTVANVWKGWIPIPRPTRHFWNTNLLDGLLTLRFFLAGGLIAAAVFSCLRRPAALVMLVGGLLGLMAFTFLHFVGAARHQGLQFIVLIAACWIGAVSNPIAIAWPRASRIAEWFEPRRDALLAGLLAIHAISGIGANVANHLLPFSASPVIAEYLEAAFPAETLFVGFDDYSYAPVSYRLNRPIYSMQMGVAPPFFSQDSRLRKKLKIEEFLDEIHALSRNRQDDFVLLLTPYREDELSAWKEDYGDVLIWKEVARFDDSTVADEGAVVYVIPHRPTPSKPTRLPFD